MRKARRAHIPVLPATLNAVEEILEEQENLIQCNGHQFFQECIVDGNGKAHVMFACPEVINDVILNEGTELHADAIFKVVPSIPKCRSSGKKSIPEKVNSPSILLKSQDSLHNGDIFALHLTIMIPIAKRRNPKYDSDTPRKVDSVFGEMNNTDIVVKKRKLFNEFECPEKPKVSKVLKPKVDLSMSFGSPTLDTENTSLTASVLHKKTTLFNYGFCKNSVRWSFSTNEDALKAAFEKEDNESNLIGDFSQSFLLPLLSLGRHADLRSISPDVLAHLLEGKFNDCINSYLIIDCRYPYEYEGGHIRGAINIITKEQLIKDYTAQIAKTYYNKVFIKLQI